MSLSENLKRIRQQFNLTQEELADIAGVSGALVRAWEHGEEYPRMIAVERISSHLKISKLEIMSEEDIAARVWLKDVPVSSLVDELQTRKGVYFDYLSYEQVKNMIINGPCTLLMVCY